MQRVNVRIDRLRLTALGESPQFRQRVRVVLLNVLAGTGNSQLVEQLKKSGTEPFQEIAGLARTGLLGPVRKGALGRAQRLLQAGHAERFAKGVIAAFSQKIELVA